VGAARESPNGVPAMFAIPLRAELCLTWRRTQRAVVWEDLQWHTAADTRAQRRSDPRRRAPGGWVPPIGAEARLLRGSGAVADSTRVVAMELGFVAKLTAARWVKGRMG
jgi:hypothetical protein